MRVWPVHVVSFKFATFCVSFLLPRSYSYRISSVFQFNEVVGRARECETFSNRPIAPRGSCRPERCLREVEKNATVVKIITYNYKVRYSGPGRVQLLAVDGTFAILVHLVVAGIDAERFAPSALL